MKNVTKTTLILAIFLTLGTTTSVKAQGLNFFALVGKAVGMTTGDIVFKGKNHNGVEWSFMVNVSYASKPITPAKQCLSGFAEISNGVKVASFNTEANVAPAKMFMSANDTRLAFMKVQPVYTSSMPILIPLSGSGFKNTNTQFPTINEVACL